MFNSLQIKLLSMSVSVLREDKEFEICTINLEFKSGLVFFIKNLNNQDFTRSPDSIKIHFTSEIPSNPKKIEFNYDVMNMSKYLLNPTI